MEKSQMEKKINNFIDSSIGETKNTGIGKPELLRWASKVTELPVTGWSSLRDGSVILRILQILWPSIAKEMVDSYKDEDIWAAVISSFELIGIPTKILDIPNIRNGKGKPCYNLLVTLFFLHSLISVNCGCIDFALPIDADVVSFLESSECVSVVMKSRQAMALAGQNTTTTTTSFANNNTSFTQTTCMSGISCMIEEEMMKQFGVAKQQNIQYKAEPIKPIDKDKEIFTKVTGRSMISEQDNYSVTVQNNLDPITENNELKEEEVKEDFNREEKNGFSNDFSIKNNDIESNEAKAIDQFELDDKNKKELELDIKNNGDKINETECNIVENQTNSLQINEMEKQTVENEINKKEVIKEKPTNLDVNLEKNTKMSSPKQELQVHFCSLSRSNSLADCSSPSVVQNSKIETYGSIKMFSSLRRSLSRNNSRIFSDSVGDFSQNISPEDKKKNIEPSKPRMKAVFSFDAVHDEQHYSISKGSTVELSSDEEDNKEEKESIDKSEVIKEPELILSLPDVNIEDSSEEKNSSLSINEQQEKILVRNEEIKIEDGNCCVNGEEQKNDDIEKNNEISNEVNVYQEVVVSDPVDYKSKICAITKESMKYEAEVKALIQENNVLKEELEYQQKAHNKRIADVIKEQKDLQKKFSIQLAELVSSTVLENVLSSYNLNQKIIDECKSKVTDELKTIDDELFISYLQK